MADNYLEKKMEEHRRGAAPAHPRTLGPLGVPRGSVCLPLDVRTVFIAPCEADAEVAAELVRTFGEAGCAVGFALKDIKEGRALAQATSTRHYPLEVPEALARFTADKGAPELLITVSQGAATLKFTDSERTLQGSPRQIADTALVLSLAAARHIR